MQPKPKFIRLVHRGTGNLGEFNFEATPKYLAISHAWREQLFPSRQPSFLESPGATILAHVGADIEYCWVDTWCIDQDDPDDKARHIPYMGSIYGEAEVVVVVLGKRLKTTQQELDKITKSLGWMMHAFDEEDWDSVRQERRKEDVMESISQVLGLIENLATSEWASRIWTLQEYILSRSVVWIGQDQIPLTINDSIFFKVTDSEEMFLRDGRRLGEHRKIFGRINGMASSRQRLNDVTRVMEMAALRSCAIPEDAVYGLMAASEVVIRTAYGEGKEAAWTRWWEQAIRAGHIRWCLLPKPWLDVTGGNCAMPPFSLRSAVSVSSFLNQVLPFGDVRCERGVVELSGRHLGVVKAIRNLGSPYVQEDSRYYAELTLVLFARGNWGRALAIASAFGGGRYDWKQRITITYVLVSNHQKAIECVEKGTQMQFFCDTGKLVRTDYVWKDFILLQQGVMSGLTDCNASLATIECASKHQIYVILAVGRPFQLDKAHNYELVDFGARTPDERSVAMMLQSPDGADGGNASLHKVGMILPMNITDSFEEAKKFRCFFVKDSRKLQNYRFGGEACAICQAPLG
jgi:hypothetical protein